MRDGCPFPRGKGAGLPSRAACEGRLPPLLSPPQLRGPSLPSSSERRGGGTRCYKPRPLCHSVSPSRVRSPVPQVSCGRGPFSLLSVSCPQDPSAPPVLWPCPCPGGRGRRNTLPVPLRLRGLHGRILFPRCRWATWREGREDGGGVFSPDSWSASLPQASLSDHG